MSIQMNYEIMIIVSSFSLLEIMVQVVTFTMLVLELAHLLLFYLHFLINYPIVPNIPKNSSFQLHLFISISFPLFLIYIILCIKKKNIKDIIKIKSNLAYNPNSYLSIASLGGLIKYAAFYNFSFSNLFIPKLNNIFFFSCIYYSTENFFSGSKYISKFFLFLQFFILFLFYF